MKKRSKQARAEGIVLRAVTEARRMLDYPVTADDRWATLEAAVRIPQRRARKKRV